jgi:y4mF family transcriptional regulator
MNALEIGNLIRYHRKAAGLTQKELADLAGIGKTVVFDLEKGKESVQIDTMLAMFSVLNMALKVEGPLVEKYHREKLKAGV